MQRARGFSDLAARAAPAELGRGALMGALIGALAGLAGLRQQQLALDAAQAGLAQARAEWAQLQAERDRLAEQARARQAASALLARVQAAQQGRAHLLAILDDLGQAPGPVLSLLRLDAQGLRLQGQAEPAQLEGWALQRPSLAVGLGSPELVELMPAPAGPAARFVLHWPARAAKAAP